jgi:hypothetical protein
LARIAASGMTAASGGFGPGFFAGQMRWFQ